MIFFLDMDGVLNTARVCLTHPKDTIHNMYGRIDPICVNFINKWAAIIKDEYNVDTEIVLSSTWRGRHDESGTLDMMFGAMGLQPFVHKDFKTRRTGMTIDGVSDIRGFQIRDWLNDHPEVKNWIIIDDDSDFTEEQKPRHIHTDVNNGILFEHHLQFEEMIEKIYSGEI
jgi:hypothetical protein